VYFVGNALQPFMAGRISAEGAQFFGFLVVGIAAHLFISAGASAPATTLATAVSTGTWEAFLTTPTRLTTLLVGMNAYSLAWTGLKVLVVLAAGWLLGAHVVWARALPSAAILLLTVLAHVPFGIAAGALTLAFRTTAGIPEGVVLVSALLGGVYYPTSVVPTVVREVSVVLPLTYGLRALRRVFLDGLPLRAVASDLTILVGMTAVSLAVGVFLFSAALRYARRTGTLAQY
jgi:ABC-2 type transport system permease protein